MPVVPGAEGQLPRPARGAVGRRRARSRGGSRRSRGRRSGPSRPPARRRATGAARSRCGGGTGRRGGAHAARAVLQRAGRPKSSGLPSDRRWPTSSRCASRPTSCPSCPDLRPMLPRPLPAPFDSDEHLFEPWWGGERALVSIGPAELAGARRGRDPRRRGTRPDGGPARAGRAGRPGRGAVGDPRRRAGRGRCRRPGRRRRAGPPAGRASPAGPWRSSPSTCSTSTGGRCCRSRSSAGASRSASVLRPGDEVVAVPAIATEGIALFEAAVAQGIAGILARQRHESVPARRPQPAVALRGGGAGRRRPPSRARWRARGAGRGGRAGPGADQPVAVRRGLRPDGRRGSDLSPRAAAGAPRASAPRRAGSR